MSILDPEWVDEFPHLVPDVSAMADRSHTWVHDHAEELGGQRFPYSKTATQQTVWRFPRDVDERIHLLLGGPT